MSFVKYTTKFGISIKWHNKIIAKGKLGKFLYAGNSQKGKITEVETEFLSDNFYTYKTSS
jgi:hypothetical protein